MYITIYVKDAKTKHRKKALRQTENLTIHWTFGGAKTRTHSFAVTHTKTGVLVADWFKYAEEAYQFAQKHDAFFKDCPSDIGSGEFKTWVTERKESLSNMFFDTHEYS